MGAERRQHGLGTAWLSRNDYFKVGYEIHEARDEQIYIPLAAQCDVSALSSCSTPPSRHQGINRDEHAQCKVGLHFGEHQGNSGTETKGSFQSHKTPARVAPQVLKTDLIIVVYHRHVS